MRVVIAEDQALLREGLASLLEDAGNEVVGRAKDADQLLVAVAEHEPDLAIVDVRMPPTFQHEGLQAAAQIRTRYPSVGVLVLSQHVITDHALELVSTSGFGYLLKDRVLDVDHFLDAATRVAAGGSALDPEIVARLIKPAATSIDPLAPLTPREREVLALMAEGLTNAAIAKRLWLTEKTVETHVRNIMLKLDLPSNSNDHRRVLAVVTYLTAQTESPGITRSPNQG